VIPAIARTDTIGRILWRPIAIAVSVWSAAEGKPYVTRVSPQ
jgi:hypothetical protein